MVPPSAKGGMSWLCLQAILHAADSRPDTVEEMPKPEMSL